MFYKSNLTEVKKQLEAHYFMYSQAIDALDFLAGILSNYKRKNIDAYLKKEVEAKSPKTSNGYNKFYLGITKDYLNKINLYHESSTPQPFHARGEEFFCFNSSEPFTPENLLIQVKKRIDGLIESKKQLSDDINNLEAKWQEYNELATKFDKFSESLHFYTKDMLNGKESYKISFYQSI